MRQRRGFERLLETSPDAEAAAIEVERIAGSILLICGGDDQLWPSDLNARRIAARLCEHRHEVLVLEYPRAGHSSVSYALPGMPRLVSFSPR
jgi:acetyl esterase/lipase